MQKHLIIGCGLLLFVLALLVGGRMFLAQMPPEAEPIACTMDAMLCPDGSSVGRVGPSCEFAPCPHVPEPIEDPMLNVMEPKPEETVTSPLVVNGTAHGSWFFEGTFPVYLVDKDERIIAEAQAVAKEDWMRDGLVPFTASLNYLFSSDTQYDQGAIVLMGANPSDLPENEKMRKVPINFEVGQ